MASPHKAKATFFACLFLVFAFVETCEAAEWSASPSIQLREDYDDNILLSTQSHQAVTSTWVTPKLDFGAAFDTWQVNGETGLTRRYFPGHSNLNTDAQNLSLGSSYTAERDVWQLNASSSKTSYLAGATISPETGLFTQNVSSDTNTVSPSWTWLMTESTQLQLTYSYSDISFVSNVSTGLFDYSSSTASATLSNQFDVSTKIFLQPSYSVFRVPATTFESKTKSYQVGVTRSLSETMNATFSIGERSTLNQQEVATCALSFGPLCLMPGPQQTASNRNASSIFNASLDKQFELVHLTAAASRSFAPSAVSRLERTDSASLSFSRPFTEKLTVNLITSGYNVHADTGSASSIDNRRVYQIQPGLSWQWTPECNLGMGYSYTHLQLITEATPAASHAAYLTLTYQWPKLSISR